jgi:hypothetical protein
VPVYAQIVDKTRNLVVGNMVTSVRVTALVDMTSIGLSLPVTGG